MKIIEEKQKISLLKERNSLLKKCKTFEELLDISIDTLNNKYPLLSCSGNTFITDNLTEDLDSLINKGSSTLNTDGKLIYRINEKGLLTTNSQSGISDIEIKQRAFLEGIIDRSSAHILLKLINEHDGIICTYTEHNISTKNLRGYPVSYVKSNEITQSHFVPTTYMTQTPVDFIFDGLVNTKLKKILKNDYVTIHCVDTKFGRKSYGKNGLFNIVLRMLELLETVR